ncbi:EAL domain-containing protein [Aestuariibacter salexigens]|uniref:EAL domain-containing protein n=1 Tax=Aestuariibacter salexigens TaxID=226010 RepID=UPI00040659F4|nr:EAL domain-containing protein [Aestuariibacter salexigens]
MPVKFVGTFILLLSLAWLDVSAQDATPPLTESSVRTLSISQDFTHTDLENNIRVAKPPRYSQLSDVQLLRGWQPVVDVTPLNPDESLWVNFSIANHGSGTSNLSFKLANPALDEIDVYLVDERNRILRSYLIGATRDFSLRPYHHRHFIVPITLRPQQTIDVYVRIVDDGPMVFPMSLWERAALIAEEQVLLICIGIIVGALIILTAYYLITYVLLHSPVRFWYALACAFLLLAMLSIEGVIGQLTGLSAYTTITSHVLLGLVLFSAAKVAHALLHHIPVYWRYCGYTLASAQIVTPFILTTYWQTVVTTAIMAAAFLLQLILAIVYRSKQDSLPNRLYILGWMTIITVSAIDVSMHLSGQALSGYTNLLMIFLIMLGVLCLAMALEAHEEVLVRATQQKQQSRIHSLHQFYDLFRNSAEGLYTSTLDGRLVSVNPAMCSLFGFPDEETMLTQVTSTSSFYANETDRLALVDDIQKFGMVLGREIKGIRRDGSEFWFSISCQLREEQNQTFIYGSIFDITERKQSSISLEYLATHDSLTGVYNRREFERRLRKALANALEQGSQLTLLYMDLDQFKIVNDTCGHKAGDMLIKQLSQQLNETVSDKGMLARLGGDEFGVMLEDEQAEMAYLLANRLLNVVQEFRFIWDNRIFTLGISIGLVEWSEQVKSPEQLMSMADAACYMAKEQGRNQIHRYSQQDKHMQRYEKELNWVTQITNAFEQERFVLYFQHYRPLQAAVKGHHYELLLRLRDDEGEIVPPGAFLPAAERYNMTAQIDRWVIEHYFRWLADNPEHMHGLASASINLSGHSLADKDLKLFVLNAFEKFSVPYHKICFEITESQAIVKMDETLSFIKTFKQLGCSFALDDFGSGFSSYGYLKNLPVDLVKIDGGFVKDLLIDPIDMAMVSSIKDVAKAMGMKTVAEFVESKEIMIELGKMGVDFAQGYGVARPAPLQDFSPFQSTTDAPS